MQESHQFPQGGELVEILMRRTTTLFESEVRTFSEKQIKESLAIIDSH